MYDATQIFDGTPPNTGVAIIASRASTNIIDLLVARDVGAGMDTPLGVHVLLTQAFAGATSLQISFQTCATATGTFVTLLQSPVYPVAQLIAGAPLFRYAVPLNQLLNATAGVLAPPGRFLQLFYTVAGGPFTSGAIFSYLGVEADRSEFYAYPSNYVAATAAGEV
jgi:hypothetical protein